MSQDNKSTSVTDRAQVLDAISDLLIGISLVAKSIGRMIKELTKKGETHEEEGHDSSD